MNEREHHPLVSGQPRIFVRGRHRTNIVPAVMPEAFARAGWSMVDGFDCDVLWDMPGPNEGARSLLRAEQRYNYFADAYALGNKFELYRHLCAARAALGRGGAALYDFFPRTFSMPEEYGALRRAAAGSPEARWICKPKRAARGEGLTVLHDVRDAPRDPEWLVQEYIAAPHLIDGHKYSLRIYALITSLDPLQAYLYHEGKCNIASRAYNLDAAGLGDRFVHLTNHSVASKDRETAEPVRYLMLSEYLRWMRARGHDDAALWGRIRQTVASTLLAVRGSMLQAMRSHGWAPERCFELIGVDIMLDETGKPWLLECNRSPALYVHAPDLEAMTRELLADTLALVAPRGGARGCERFEPLFDRAELAAAYTAPRASELARLADRRPLWRFAPGQCEAAVVDGRPVLFSPTSGRFVAVSATGLRLLCAAADGRTVPEAIAAVPGVGEAAGWDTIAELVDAGLLRLRDPETGGDDARLPELPLNEDDASPGPGATVLAASGPEHLAMAIRLRSAFAEAARRRGAREAVVDHESELGNLYDQYGMAGEAHASHVRALAAGGEADPWLRFNAAVTAFRAGLFAEADERFGALLAAEEAEADGPGAELLAAQAMVAAARGEVARVERLLAAAHALAERQGEAARSEVALCEGESWLRLGERARARAALRRGLASLETSGGVPGVDQVGFHVALAECDERDPTHVLAALRLLPKALVMESNTWWHVPRLLRRVLSLAEQGWPGQATEVEAWKYELRRLVRFAACRRDCGAAAARLGALLDHLERA